MLGCHGLAFDSVLLMFVIFIYDQENLSKGSSAQLLANLEFLEYRFAFTIEIALPYRVFCLFFILFFKIQNQDHISHCYKLTS